MLRRSGTMKMAMMMAFAGVGVVVNLSPLAQASSPYVSYTGSFFWESTDLKAHYNVEASALIYYGDRLVVGGQRVQNDGVDENAETANLLTSSEREHSHECWLGEFRSINLDTVHDDDAAAPSFLAPVELLGPTGSDTSSSAALSSPGSTNTGTSTFTPPPPHCSIQAIQEWVHGGVIVLGIKIIYEAGGVLFSSFLQMPSTSSTTTSSSTSLGSTPATLVTSKGLPVGMIVADRTNTQERPLVLVATLGYDMRIKQEGAASGVAPIEAYDLHLHAYRQSLPVESAENGPFTLVWQQTYPDLIGSDEHFEFGGMVASGDLLFLAGSTGGNTTSRTTSTATTVEDDTDGFMLQIDLETGRLLYNEQWDKEQDESFTRIGQDAYNEYIHGVCQDPLDSNIVYVVGNRRLVSSSGSRNSAASKPQIAKIHIDTLGMEWSRDLVVDSEEDYTIELTHCVASVENDEATMTAERSIFVAGTIRLSTKDTGDNGGQRERQRQLQHATLPDISSPVTVFRLDSQGDVVWNTINKADSDNLPQNLVGLEYDGLSLLVVGSITQSATAGSAAATPTTTQVKIVQIDPFDGAIGTVPAATDSTGSTTTSNNNWSNTDSSTMELSSWQSSRGLWIVGIVWFGLGLLGCVYRFVGLSFLPSWRRNKYSHVVTSNRHEDPAMMMAHHHPDLQVTESVLGGRHGVWAQLSDQKLQHRLSSTHRPTLQAAAATAEDYNFMSNRVFRTSSSASTTTDYPPMT